jgi:hypothetical protein
MHKGRQWRQVLPRVLTPGCFNRGAPVRLILYAVWFYANDFFTAISEKSDTLDVDLTAARITWKGAMDVGSFHFGYRIEQSFQNHIPGYKTVIQLVDNIGGASVSEWHHQDDDEAWSASSFFLYQFGTLTNDVGSGLFGPVVHMAARAVTYHEET